MPYQDRFPEDMASVDALAQPVSAPPREPDSARKIQIVIVVGLVAAIAVAVFGSYGG